jgi:hypothetical protein
VSYARAGSSPAFGTIYILAAFAVLVRACAARLRPAFGTIYILAAFAVLVQSYVGA